LIGPGPPFAGAGFALGYVSDSLAFALPRKIVTSSIA
jgi:hypothetical protein